MRWPWSGEQAARAPPRCVCVFLDDSPGAERAFAWAQRNLVDPKRDRHARHSCDGVRASRCEELLTASVALGRSQLASRGGGHTAGVHRRRHPCVLGLRLGHRRRRRCALRCARRCAVLLRADSQQAILGCGAADDLAVAGKALADAAATRYGATLARFADEARRGGARDVETSVLRGDVAGLAGPLAVDYAAQHHCDVAVVGSRGLGAFKRCVAAER